MNLQVLSGAGTTDATPNGLGNIIIGHNEKRGDGTDSKTGSHNLVIGEQNHYSRFGGIAGGMRNNISASYASVTGGNGNTANGEYSSVSGGHLNQATNEYASVSGGWGNTGSGGSSTVGGGNKNLAGGGNASVSGGYQRSAARIADWAAGSLWQDQ